MAHTSRIGSFQRMKSINRSLILNTIREHGPISRADVAKQTHLTPPTVSNMVRELLESEIIIETRQGTSKGGRRPTMLEVDTQHFYLLGLDVGPNNVKAILCDLNARIIDAYEKDVPRPITNDRLLDLMKTCIHTLFDRSNMNPERFIGIGVGMHGMVDVWRGVSLYAPILQLSDIPIQASLEDEFKMVVKVENDANVMALGESWFGQGRHAPSLACINVGRGIGAGIMVNGRLSRGSHFITGEIGHMSIDINGPKCSCGNYGCLQTFATGPAIAEKAAKEVAQGQKTLLTEICSGDSQAVTGEKVYEAARQGDEICRRILHEAGHYLGIGLVNLLHTVDPDRMIIGGGVAKAGEYILEPIKKTIAQQALTAPAKQTDVTVSELGDHATAIGAVSMLLVDLFSTKAAD